MLKTTSFTEERTLQNLRGFPLNLSFLCHSVSSTQDTPSQNCSSPSCRLVAVGEEPLSEIESAILCFQNRQITSLQANIFVCLVCSYIMSFLYYLSIIKRLLQTKDSGLCPLGNGNEEHDQKRRPEGKSKLQEKINSISFWSRINQITLCHQHYCCLWRRVLLNPSLLLKN